MSSTINDVFVMVIDDQLNSGGADKRLDKYQTFIDSVNRILNGSWILKPHFCDNPGDIATIQVENGQSKLAIVDMVLNEQKWSANSINKLDQKLRKERWPMILVSARFGSEEAIQRVNNLIGDHSAEMTIPYQFLMWSAIEKAVVGVEVEEFAFIIQSVLSKSQNQDLLFKKGYDEPIDFLHITDPHFGKATWDVGKLMSLRDELRNKNLGEADFLAITGDIADQGAPDQYKLALEFFYALAKREIVVNSNLKLPKDRVFLCPGNHDFSRRLALAANISVDKAFTIENKIQPENLWARDYSWIPYERFEADIAGHQKNWIPKPGYRINSRFKNAGIVVLELNVERYNIDCYQEGFADQEMRNSLNEAVDEVSKIRKAKECLIVLAHRHESDYWIELAQTIDSVLKGLSLDGPLILMCGHEHQDKISTELGDKALFIRGKSPIPGASRTALSLPIINNIRLIRKDNKVAGVEAYQFYLEERNWLISSEGKKVYKYDYKKQIWRN